jgi:predicted amidophosphoribosyltransferase
VAGRAGLALAPVLVRHDRAARQARARRSVRRAAGRIVIGASGPVRGPAVLVDDVHTTGSTLDACARALTAAGAARVVAVTYARTL